MELLSEKVNAHSSWVMSVAFSPDGKKIVSGSMDQTIKVWDVGAPRSPQIAPPWPKLTLAGLSGRHDGAVEREDQRPQRLHQLGHVFPGRDQDRVGIARPDDQSLGFGCAFAPQITSPWSKLTFAGLSGRHDGAVEREDERPQSQDLIGRIFPGRDQDCVRIGRRDDQSLGFWCAEALKSPLLGQN